MKTVRNLIILLIITMICVACSSNDKPIEKESIIGKWIVTNQEVELKKFTNKYGQIHVLEAMRIQQQFTEGAIIEFLPDGTVKLGNIPARYSLQNQDGYNFIKIIGEASESGHPIELKKDKLQLSVFLLKRST
jgi:hypothetical protein